jgi:ketosteroid isomerase-like protein
VPRSPEDVDQFFTKLQSDMRNPDLSQDAITEAFNAIQQLAREGEPAKASHPPDGVGSFCQSCGAGNNSVNNFCVACGTALREVTGPSASPGAAPGRHHYHHHYHRHEFSGSPAVAPFIAPSIGAPAPLRDAGRAPRAPAGSQPLSRAEVSVRKISQDWALACNTKHLDDLVSLYSPDAIVMRPNVPAIRGTAAIREFFFSVLDAGLGEVELESQRVEVIGDVGYEAGRCKMLVPSTMGKRREERGKFLIISHKQEGEWKAVADCWSTDLSLGGDPTANSGAASPGAASVRPRK